MNKYQVLNDNVRSKKINHGEMLSNGLTERFNNIVCKLQVLNEKFDADEENETVYKRYTKKEFFNSKEKFIRFKNIWLKIRDEELISNCESKTFAEQLMMKNNVPRKYWDFYSPKKMKM